MSDYSAFVGASAPLTLGDIVARTAAAPESYYLPEEALFQWHYLKGGKSAERVTARGFAYTYGEGPVTFPDDLTRASRTVITDHRGRRRSGLQVQARHRHARRAPAPADARGTRGTERLPSGLHCAGWDI